MNWRNFWHRLWPVILWYRLTMSYREQFVNRVGVAAKYRGDSEMDSIITLGLYLDMATSAMDDTAAATRESAKAFEALTDEIGGEDAIR